MELSLLRAGIPLEVLKAMSEIDVWIYYFILRKNEEIDQAHNEADMQARASRRV